jgi:hypothetical protein
MIENIAAQDAEIDRLKQVVDAAHGLSFGEDWNKGAQAVAHGYRTKLLIALGRALGRDASPQAQAAMFTGWCSSAARG